MSTHLDPTLFGLEDAFNGFSVDDLDAAEVFYRDTLGIPVDRSEEPMGMLQLRLGPRSVLVYPKGPAHVPASYTVLNFPSDDVHATVRELTGRGLSFLRYDGMPQDELGVMTGGGPLIAWFTDPAGNVHSVIAREG
ncbi:putative cell wall protein [Serinicoccus hydrothermalis]|uniref:Putative cell wall protein n=1 Tax=Serinicoccus hydrothermalis TaxID=1758689 RepID=A0A1B1NDD4_9MICO|nr:VOC family protein [Serinicoccus hydrothermalis]ANS79449.1 putative cell wall protein [Serinicoccus hydrothermalis]